MAGIYIHIPFCAQKCSYCNFYSIANKSLKDDFLVALKSEIQARKDELNHHPIKTIYFGGGTPSILSADEIQSLLELIYSHYQCDHSIEITLEANPDDLTFDYLTKLSHTKINRLSIGIQSFSDPILKQINRRHTALQAIQSIENAKKNGFSNLSIDLIYGIPGQSDKQWKENLAIVAQHNIPHLSCYALTVEEGTSLFKKIELKKQQMPSEEEAIRQFELLMDFAEKNEYQHYEISNYCKEGFQSQHNSAYWDGTSYLGFGPGAHSYLPHQRRWNISNVSKYIRAIHQQESFSETETLSPRDQYNEYILTSLRTSLGCDLSKIKHQFGTPEFLWIENQLQKIDASLYTNQNQHITLTRKGKHWADYITRELFMEE